MTKYSVSASMLMLAAAWAWLAWGQAPRGKAPRGKAPRPPGLEAQEPPGPRDRDGVLGGPPMGSGMGAPPGIPRLTEAQQAALRAMNEAGAPLERAVNEVRNDLNMAIYADRSNPAEIRVKVEKLAAAELAHATARAEAFAELQASPNRLDLPRDQILFIMMFSRGPGGGPGEFGGPGGFGGGPGGPGDGAAGMGGRRPPPIKGGFE